jgi:hypothetical protein
MNKCSGNAPNKRSVPGREKQSEQPGGVDDFFSKATAYPN